MPQTKKKTATRTAAKKQACSAKRAASTKTCRKAQQANGREKIHVCIITAMSMIAAILLCANIAIMIA